MFLAGLWRAVCFLGSVMDRRMPGRAYDQTLYAVWLEKRFQDVLDPYGVRNQALAEVGQFTDGNPAATCLGLRQSDRPSGRPLDPARRTRPLREHLHREADRAQSRWFPPRAFGPLTWKPHSRCQKRQNRHDRTCTEPHGKREPRPDPRRSARRLALVVAGHWRSWR